MTVLTMRRVREHFVVTGPDIEPFKTRREARDWCREHFRGSPIREIRRGGRKKAPCRQKLGGAGGEARGGRGLGPGRVALA
jgi:hypothetical protein